MDGLSKAISTRAWRFCVRVAVALCLIAFGVGDAVERGLGGHASLDSALTYAVSADQTASLSTDHSGLHVDGQSGDADLDGKLVGHGCHACAALPQPMLQAAAAPTVLGSSLSWASVPSTAGRKPLIDLPPPRA